MLTVLWVLSVASVVALVAVTAGRAGVHAGRNRVELTRAMWAATGCARRAEAAADAVLRDALTPDVATRAWRTLDSAVSESPLLAGCDVALEAAGTRLDVNAATPEMLARLFGAVVGESQAAVLADALSDWLDADDDPRPDGAERDWYAAEHRPLPRNGPIDDIAELALVRGFDQLGGLDAVRAVLGADAGRVSLATAPVAVLMAVPGIGREAADAIVAARQPDGALDDLSQIVDQLSQPAQEELFARYADAARATTPDPDAWLVTVRAANGTPPNTVLLRWRLVRAGRPRHRRPYLEHDMRRTMRGNI